VKVNRSIYTSDRKGATSNSRKSDGRNRQTIGGRGAKSLLGQDISGAHELPNRPNYRAGQWYAFFSY